MKNLSVLTQVVWFNRISLFVVFFWFGLLKIIHISPAEGLVQHLHQLTIAPFVSIETFVPLLGWMECFIGILFLIPSLTKVAYWLFLAQMTTTFLPLFMLPNDTWSGIALSLVGQYIVKNIVLVAAAYMIYVVHTEYTKTEETANTAKQNKWELSF